MQTVAPPAVVPAVGRPAGWRVLVLYEPGRSGAAVLELARELAIEDRAMLTVVGVVPQSPVPHCGGSAADLNCAIRETVEQELAEAREQLGNAADRAAFQLLIDGTDPPLHEWCAAAGFDVILLPTRRRPLRSLKHPAAARLKQRTTADVRVVGARGA